MKTIRIFGKLAAVGLLVLIACNPDDPDPNVPGNNSNKKPANISPTCTASATPASGTVPLKVTFSGSGSDTDGTIVKYEWDYENDGTFDFSSATSAATTFTYTKVGNYTATLRVTDDKGGTNTSSQSITVKEITYLYPGFKDLSFTIGKYWKYRWTYDNSTNGTPKAQQTGFVTITLTEKTTVNFTGLGDLTVYKTSYTSTGATYPLTWYGRPYLAVKEGIIYMVQNQSGQWGAAELFNSQTGKFYGAQGFIGYFSPERTETLTTSFITNEFSSTYSSNGVVASEPFYKPQCETIAGVRICGDQSHDYQVKEYYLNGIGFGGFVRSGTSVFTGGGYTDIFKSTMKVWLVDTNVK